MQRHTAIPFPPVPYIPRHGHPHDGWVKEEHLPHMECAEFETDSDAFAARWRESQRWLYAIDLLNAGYYWETHEILEGLWNDVGKRSPSGEFIQGVIQIAAAILKHTTNESIPARRLADEAIRKLNKAAAAREAQSAPDFAHFGVPVASLIQATNDLLEAKTDAPPMISLRV